MLDLHSLGEVGEELPRLMLDDDTRAGLMTEWISTDHIRFNRWRRSYGGDGCAHGATTTEFADGTEPPRVGAMCVVDVWSPR